MFSVADLLTPLTGAQVRATMVAMLIALGIPADQWRKGGVWSTLLTVVANLYAGFTQVMAAAIGAGFLETASGAWLTLLAFYVYNVTRPPATFATGSVQLVNTGGGIYSFATGAAQFKNPTTGQVYANSAPFTSNPASTITVPVTCLVQGTIGTSQAGTVTGLQTAMPGVAVSNPSAIVGQDAMADADLRVLCLQKLGTLGNGGPRTAYQFAVSTALNGPVITGVSVVSGSSTVTFSSPQTLGAGALLSFASQPGALYALSAAISAATSAVLTTPYTGVTNPVTTATSGARVNINRTFVSEFSSTATVTVYLAAPTGAPASGDVTAATSNINLIARPNGVTVNVSAATPVNVTRTWTVYADGSSPNTAAQIQTLALAALTARLQGYPIGGRVVPPAMQGYLFAEFLRGVIASVDPSIYDVSDGGAADTALNAGQVATLTPTVNVVIVPQS